MAALDVNWAIEQLRAFLHASEQVAPANSPGSGVVYLGLVQRESDDKVSGLAHVAEQILDRVLPEWRAARNEQPSNSRAKWGNLRDWAGRGVVALEREDELSEKLGEDAPTLEANRLHAWVWLGAKSLWRSGHYAEAVTSAARQLNAETQNKLGRRDIGESKLFQEAFSTKPPEVGKPRLRLAVDDGSPGFIDRQAGAIQLAGGLYLGIRNIGSHEVVVEPSEDEALEQLAAFSVLARMVDVSSVLHEPGL